MLARSRAPRLPMPLPRTERPARHPTGRRRGATLALLGLLVLGKTAMAVEEPHYSVELRDGDIELRDYPALVVAEVTVEGSRRSAGNQGFRQLAGYIFGGNSRRESLPMTAPVAEERSGERIAMTAPVTQQADGERWIVRFMMPDGRSLESLPQPNDARVRLKALPATRFAVIRFSGLAGADEVAAKTRTLESFIGSRAIAATGPPTLARYDPPWTPWFLRRNEVMIPVRASAPP